MAPVGSVGDKHYGVWRWLVMELDSTWNFVPQICVIFVSAGAGGLQTTGQHQCPRRGAIGNPRLNTGAQSSLRQSGWRRGRWLWRVPVGAGSWGRSSKPCGKGVSFHRRKGIEALHSRRVSGSKRSSGRQGGASIWGWTEREERPEKRNWPLPPLRDPLVTVWRETALSPVLSKRGCCCLQHPVLSDHPFKSPH